MNAAVKATACALLSSTIVACGGGPPDAERITSACAAYVKERDAVERVPPPGSASRARDAARILKAREALSGALKDAKDTDSVRASDMRKLIDGPSRDLRTGTERAADGDPLAALEAFTRAYEPLSIEEQRATRLGFPRCGGYAPAAEDPSRRPAQYQADTILTRLDDAVMYRFLDASERRTRQWRSASSRGSRTRASTSSCGPPD